MCSSSQCVFCFLHAAAPASQPQPRRRRQRGGVFSGLLPLLILTGLLAAFLHPELAVCGVTAAASAMHHTSSKAVAALSGVQWREMPVQLTDSARTLPPHLAAWLRSSSSKLACLGAGGASAGCGVHSSSDAQQALYMPRHAHAVASGAPLTGLLAGWGPVWDWARGKQQALGAHIAALSTEEWERTLRSVNCDSMQPGCSLKRGAMHQLRTGWALAASAGNAALGHARSGSLAAGSLLREWKEHAPEARAWLQQRAGAAKQLAADGVQWAACVAQRLRAGGSPALRSPAQPVAECWLQHMGRYLEAGAALKAAGTLPAAEAAVVPPPVPEPAGAEPVLSDELAAPEPTPAPAPIPEAPAAAPEQVPEPAILPPPPVPQPAAVEPAAVALEPATLAPPPVPQPAAATPEQAPEPATLTPPPVPQPAAVAPEQAPEPAVLDVAPEAPPPSVPQPQAAADGEWVAPVIEEEDGWVAPVIEQEEEGWVAPVIEQEEVAAAPEQQQVGDGWSAPVIIDEEAGQGVVEPQVTVPAEPAVAPPPEQVRPAREQLQPASAACKLNISHADCVVVHLLAGVRTGGQARLGRQPPQPAELQPTFLCLFC